MLRPVPAGAVIMLGWGVCIGRTYDDDNGDDVLNPNMHILVLYIYLCVVTQFPYGSISRGRGKWSKCGIFS